MHWATKKRNMGHGYRLFSSHVDGNLIKKAGPRLLKVQITRMFCVMEMVFI